MKIALFQNNENEKHCLCKLVAPFSMLWNNVSQTAHVCSRNQFELGIKALTSSLLANLIYMQKMRSDDINLKPPVRARRWMLRWWRDWKFERSAGTSLEQWHSRGRCRKCHSLNRPPDWEDACDGWLWEWRTMYDKYESVQLELSAWTSLRALLHSHHFQSTTALRPDN